MSAGLSCFTPLSKRHDDDDEDGATISPLESLAEYEDVKESPRLSLSFDESDSDSPDKRRLITDEEMMKLLSGSESGSFSSSAATATISRKRDREMSGLVKRGDMLTLQEILREGPTERVNEAEQDESPPKRRRLLARSNNKTLTALPSVPTDLDAIPAAAVVKPTLSSSFKMPPPTTTRSDKSRKRNIASTFGSLKRKINTSVTNLHRTKEPEFDMLDPATYKSTDDSTITPTTPTKPNPSPSQSAPTTKTKQQQRSTPLAPNNTAIPILTPPLPLPTLPPQTSNNPFRTGPSRQDLATLIIQLQSRISDLNLENRVLRDQICLVRKDWVDATRALERERDEKQSERRRVEDGQREVFGLGVEIEELRGRLGRLERGSVVLS